MTYRPEQFYGAWVLQSWHIDYNDGRVTYPFGEQAKGQIVYTPDGAMAATISVAGRKNMGVQNVRLASEAQKSAAFDSFFHYAGDWYIDGETIVHNVTLSLNPALVGTAQIRQVKFDGDMCLQLSAHEELRDGLSRHHILDWKRKPK